ncbi:MAG: hypothetical protein KDK39_19315 [Leptospiraceae bacterium]|nr:hypothetical protein [Leptospiraceae bacterium]
MKTVRVSFFTALLFALSPGLLWATDHCIVDQAYYYCQEYAEGWSSSAARRSCQFANGSFRAGACPAAQRQGACKSTSLTKNRVWWLKYYQKTWTQMSYESMKTACKGMHDGRTNVTEWIGADPNRPNVETFNPETQFPHEKLSTLIWGKMVLAPRDRSWVLYPAVATSRSKSNGQYYELEFADGKSVYLAGWAMLKRLDWEVGTEISCYNTFKGYRENGRIQKLGAFKGGSITVAFDSGVTIEMPTWAHCQDRRVWQYKDGQSPFLSTSPDNTGETNNPSTDPQPNKPTPATTETDDELDRMEDELKDMEDELKDLEQGL